MKTMIKSSVIVCTFPNISPINTVEEGIKRGHNTNYYRFINNKTVRIAPAEGPKNLYIVCFDRIIGETEYSVLKSKSDHFVTSRASANWMESNLETPSTPIVTP